MSNELPENAFKGIHWEMVKPNEQLLSQKEARDFLKIPQHRLDKIRKKKELPHYVHKGCYFYLKADCVDWINKNQPERLKKISAK